MQSSQQPRAGRRVVSSCLAAVAGLLVAGCGTGNGGGSSSGGPPAGSSTGGPGASPGKAPTACSVGNDLAISSGEATAPAIAFGGDHFAVAWTDRSHDQGDVILTVLDREGGAAHEEPIARGAGTSVTPSVAALPGGGFLVAWEEMGGGGGTVRAVRVAEDGTRRGSPFAVSHTVSPEAHPDVAATSSGGAVAWTEATGASIGTVVNDAVEGTVTLPGAAQVALAGAGDKLGALWSAGSQIGFARLTTPLRAEQVAHPALFRSATGRANLPRLTAADGGAFFATWEDTRAGNGNESVRLTRISKEGTPGAELEISPAGGSANYPDVAWLGSAAAVVYYQFRDGPPAIYLSLVSPDLRRIGDELKVSGHGAARFPRAAWGDGTLGVAYAQRSGPVHLALVSCK
jgi:hypothetical protein